jgi:hypothetical protein
MTGEQPHLFFIHFWANDDVAKLARGLRAALERTSARRCNYRDFNRSRRVESLDIGSGG